MQLTITEGDPLLFVCVCVCVCVCVRDNGRFQPPHRHCRCRLRRYPLAAEKRCESLVTSRCILLLLWNLLLVTRWMEKEQRGSLE